MKEREKILATVVGGLAGLLVLVMGLRQVVIMPLREIDKRTATVREKIAKIQADRRLFFTAEDRLKAVTLRAFADTVEQASAVSGEMLTRQIIAAGLREADFTRTPAGPRKLRGASEIGWSVQGEGPLTNIVNLLFILDSSPWLHRTEDLVAANSEAPGRVRVHFRYLSLVIDPAPEVTRTNLAPRLTLDSPERRLLDSIVARDLLRPYIKRQLLPAPSRTTSVQPVAPGGPANFRIVSLSEWRGQPEVHVRDLAAQKTLRYRPGDELMGGTVMMVDYRPMPMPGKRFLQSDSRLVLKIDNEYWAVERGTTFADKHKLAEAELPASLAAGLKANHSVIVETNRRAGDSNQ
jgi:hypothetical protein